jgi:beta-lactamase regulating signal transducer with metallopeptidase domain
MNLTTLTASSVWTALGWTMVHFVWLATIVGLVAASGRRLLNAASSDVRYGLALGCFVALALSPIVIFVRVFDGSVPPRILPYVFAETKPTAREHSIVFRKSQPQSPLESQSWTVVRSAGQASRRKLDSVVPYLPWFWLCGSLATLLVLATGMIGVEQLRQSSRVLESGEIPSLLRTLANSLGIAVRVSVGVCERLTVPVLIGILRPMILVPPVALCGWSVEELEMVLLHELAHLRRLDNLVNLLQRVVESVLFFHPVTWWVSSWIRLERELCCDRLVVDRSGQSHAYAELLISLSCSSNRRRGAALAMADRQVSTRIRRLLNVEERTMKLTIPEGIGVLGAVSVLASLVLGSHAAQVQPASESKESVRRALRKAADDVGTLQKQEPEHALKVETLSMIAQAQLKIGDRAAALATLQRAYASVSRLDPMKSKAERMKESNVELLGALCQMAQRQREAEDLPAARATLDRLTELVDSLEATPIPEELYQFKEGDKPERNKEELGAVIRDELVLIVANERLALGDRDEALALYRRAATRSHLQNGSFKPMVMAEVGRGLYKSGDLTGGRDLISQARTAAGELTEQESKERAMSHVASAMAETGDLDGALNLVRFLGNNGRQAGIRRIIETLTENKGDRPWLVIGGIKITIGADSLMLKDKTSSLTALAKIAQVVQSFDDPLAQARTLSIIAHLQAKTGDFAGALQIIDSIPDVTRQQFPGPRDGFYESIKPATLAKVGRLQFEATNTGGAKNTFNRATSLSQAIASSDQKIVAQIILIEELLGCGLHEEARALLGEAIPFASQLPEPLRSRGLATFCKLQVKAGDAVAAHQTIDAIRAYPGLEKNQALSSLARWHAKRGDREAERRAYREALHCLEAKAPADADNQLKKNPNRNLGPVGADTFVDFESELPSGQVEFEKRMATMFLHAHLGDTQQALKVGHSIPARNVALSNLAGAQARQGDVSGACKLAASFETIPERLTAYELVACAVRDGDRPD